MQTSEQGRALITAREGCRLTPYQDSVGVWTDGTGNTHGVIPNGPPISQAKADEDLKRNLGWAEEAVNTVTHQLSQNEFDALVSFVFNVGASAFEASTMKRLLDAGQIGQVPAQFDRWHIPADITSRRNGEKAQFLGTAFEPRIA